MTPTHEAALNIARDSFAMFAAALEGLPDEALAWTPPAKDANSIAVLGSHCVTSFRFFLPLGAGQVGSIEEYRRGERAESFRVETASADALRAGFDTVLAELAPVMAKGTQGHLMARIEWPDQDPELKMTGAEALFRAIGHLREHVGQAQLVRDLWLARESATRG